MLHGRRHDEFVDQHDRDRPLRIGHVDTVSQRAELDHEDDQQVEDYRPPSFAEVEDQEGDERPEHQVDRGDQAYTLPAAIGLEIGLRIPVVIYLVSEINEHGNTHRHMYRGRLQLGSQRCAGKFHYNRPLKPYFYC